MVRVAGDLRVVIQHINSDNNVPSRQVYSEVMVIKINWGLVNRCIKDLDKLGVIIGLMIIVHQRIPIPFPYPIQKYMAISMNIAKEFSKVFLSKYWRCHDWKYEGKERKSQTSPGIRREKLKSDCREQSIGGTADLVVDLRSTGNRDLCKIWWRSGLHQTAADARLGPR